MEDGIAKGRTEGLTEGIAQGKAEGLTEGIVQGIKENQISTALKMLDLGMNIEEISESHRLDYG
jgi:predicted transposase YdaD